MVPTGVHTFQSHPVPEIALAGVTLETMAPALAALCFLTRNIHSVKVANTARSCKEDGSVGARKCFDIVLKCMFWVGRVPHNYTL
jgi:hypothetical protein